MWTLGTGDTATVGTEWGGGGKGVHGRKPSICKGLGLVVCYNLYTVGLLKVCH